MADPIQTPITVDANPAVAQLAAAVRTLLSAAGGYAVAKGWLSSDIAAALVPVVLIGVPLLWSQLRVRHNLATQQTMATALPDSIATIK